MAQDQISIVKASGDIEAWDPKKLESSLQAVKAPKELIDEIIKHIEKDVADGMTTEHIYQHALLLLKRYDSPVAAEYSLKRAIILLGPSGFPFERFVSHILRAQGYQTKVGVMVQGACVTHEVDVVAEKDDERILVEAKFHNSPEIKSDVKVALYVKARFDDIQKRFEQTDEGERYNRAWLITNTRFSSQAITYGNCVGLSLTGWNHPANHTLQDLIRNTKTHPITCLTTLSVAQKNQLLTEGTVLCREVLDNPAKLMRIGLSSASIKSVIDEGLRLCPVE